jgi:hypothetical protein
MLESVLPQGLLLLQLLVSSLTLPPLLIYFSTAAVDFEHCMHFPASGAASKAIGAFVQQHVHRACLHACCCCTSVQPSCCSG